MVEIRGDLELRRLRGACLESCWNEQAVAKERAQQPTSFRYQRSKTDPFEERTDADVLALVWQAAESTRNSLEGLGYVVRYGQSTHKRTDRAANTPETRSQSGFSVDLTLETSGGDAWLETVWGDSGTLEASAKQAGKKLEKYKNAVKEAQLFPGRWKLDEHLSGALLKPPRVFGTLVVSTTGYRLKLDGNDAVVRTFGEEVGASSSQRPKRNRRQEALNQKVCRQRRLRADNRRTLRGSQTRILKKPAAARPNVTS